MKKTVLATLAVGMILGMGSGVSAAPVTDVVEWNTGYFVPGQSETYNSPYYRWWDEDWGWQHDAISGGTTASLYISAWDVDKSSGEMDMIKIWDYSAANWVDLGDLDGLNNDWGYTNYDISAYLDDIALGLKVWIDIDRTHTWDTWAVTLAKSVLSVDGGVIPDPDPDPVPEPASMLLMGTGLAGLLGARLRRKKQD